MKQPPKSEAHVKDLVRQWMHAKGMWSFAPVSNGMGAHGVHDRLGCLPIVVTPEMVGKKIGLFVSVESKRPGRRNEKNRGMSSHQQTNLEEINEAGGIAICCDGQEDLDALWRRILGLLQHPKSEMGVIDGTLVKIPA